MTRGPRGESPWLTLAQDLRRGPAGPPQRGSSWPQPCLGPDVCGADGTAGFPQDEAQQWRKIDLLTPGGQGAGRGPGSQDRRLRWLCAGLSRHPGRLCRPNLQQLSKLVQCQVKPVQPGCGRLKPRCGNVLSTYQALQSLAHPRPAEAEPP